MNIYRRYGAGLMCVMGIGLTAILWGGSVQGDAGHHHDADHDHQNERHQDKNSQHGQDDHGSHAPKGVHGGELFHNGTIEVELLLFESSDEARFRLWVTDAAENLPSGEPLGNALRIELTRLSGESTTLTFVSRQGFFESTEVVEEPHAFDGEIVLALPSDTHRWSFSSREGRAEIPADVAQEAGIRTQVARAAAIRNTLTVYGRTVIDPSRISHIQARFPGTITQVNVNIGDAVRAGDVLAEIESNESLKRYALKAPFDGVITARHANAGELAREQPLLTLVNGAALWAEFKVFPRQQGQMAEGQPVVISAQGVDVPSSISHIVPSDNGQPYLIARALLTGSDHAWSPGLLVKGQVQTGSTPVAVAIDRRALQTMNDTTVAFVQVGQQYEARPLRLGQRNHDIAEVLSGIAAGEAYVVDNSFLIKAEIEKSSASHEH